MRVIVLSLLVGVVFAVPQGYNYRAQHGSNDISDFTYEQLQLLQQFASQQEQSEAQHQFIKIVEPAAAPVVTQNVVQANNNVDSVIQHIQELASYGEPEQIKLQPPKEQTQELPRDVAIPVEQPQQQPEQQQPQNQLQTQAQSQLQLQLRPQPEPELQIQFQFLQKPQEQPQSVPELQQQQSVQHSLDSLSLPQLQTTQDQPKAANVNPPSLPTQYNKKFYYLSAPKEDLDQTDELQSKLKQIKKNLRVLFIKAPEQKGLEKAALQLVKDAQSSQTAIYVLTKQHNAADLVNKLQQLPTTTQQRPEVVFVKYRTPEEAEHAQRTIQSQYESLDGPNHFNYEGAVPTQNFIGSLAAIEPRQGSFEENAAKEAATTSSLDYLPPTE